MKASEATLQQAEMNLRLPGQYFDAETGLHDNWHRSYDARPDSPTHGRYLTPDPAGYPDGLDAYAYVGGDPVNNVDPTGLYQEDIHYYMTYFLATRPASTNGQPAALPPQTSTWTTTQLPGPWMIPLG